MRLALGRVGWWSGRLLSATLVSWVVALGVSASPAAAQDGDHYSVTYVALSCPSYTDIFANRARNNIQESLKDLGEDSQYTASDFQVNPDAEAMALQDRCTPITGWQFTLGTGITAGPVGVWGSLSIVTNPYDTAITTQDTTPLLDQNGVKIGNETIAGATTVELTDPQRAQASNSGQLWAQGGTPTHPVLDNTFPGPEFGFGALRCAVDALNGDNVEFIYFPAGVTHVFCYGIYVKPPPTSGLITIKKQVTGAPSGENPSFPFNGTISYDPTGFTLANGGSMDFYRAGGATWNVTEGSVPNHVLTGVTCTAVTLPGGTPVVPHYTVDGGKTSITLAANEHVTCTYLNSYVPPDKGGLTITKITRGGVNSFRYLVQGEGESHKATATTQEPGVPAAAEPTPLALAPGTYTIRERPKPVVGGHWRLVSVRCNGVKQSVTEPVTVQIHAGVATACTYVNVFIPSGAISISKVTTGATGTATFLIGPETGTPAQYLQHATTTAELTPADAVPASAADATDHLRLGPYTIIEQLPPSVAPDSWALVSVLCDGVAVPFAQGTVHITLTRENPSVHCQFDDLFSSNPPPIPPPPNPPRGGNIRPPAFATGDLVVTKRASSPVVVVGSVVTYRITVKNLGPDPAQRVTLTDQHFGSAKVVGVHNPVGTCQVHATIVCQLKTLRRGASVVLTVQLVPTAPASPFTNRAVAGTATNERTLANNSASARVRVIAAPAPPAPPPGRG